MLVVYSNREEQLTTPTPVIDLEEVSRQAGLIEKQNQEEETINITQEKIVLLEKHLNELQNQKFGKTEQPEVTEQIVDDFKPQEELLV